MSDKPKQRTGIFTAAREVAKIDRIDARPGFEQYIDDQLLHALAQKISEALSDGRWYVVKMGPLLKRNMLDFPMRGYYRYERQVFVALESARDAEVGEYAVHGIPENTLHDKYRLIAYENDSSLDSVQGRELMFRREYFFTGDEMPLTAWERAT